MSQEKSEFHDEEFRRRMDKLTETIAANHIKGQVVKTIPKYEAYDRHARAERRIWKRFFGS